MIPKVGKVERIYPTRSSTDNPRNDMSNQHSKPRPENDFASILQEELEHSEPSQVEEPVKKLILQKNVEISPNVQQLYELSKRNK